MKQKNELALLPDPQKFLPAAEDIENVLSELRDVLSRSVFGVISIAAGGAGVFKIQEPGADEPGPGGESVEGVIVASHPVNIRWGHDFGSRVQGELPLCRSMDGLTGVNQETGETFDCATCPYNQFKADGGRKECANKRQLYIMREGDLIPMLFSLPPSALRAYDNYRIQAALSLRCPMSALLTRITLKNKTNANGIAYSSPVFTAVGKLPPEEGKRMEAFARQIMQAAQRAGISADNLSDQAVAASGGFVVSDEDLPDFGD